MKRILVPIDGSPRSLFALEQVKTMFSPKAFEVVLIMVRENTGYVKNIEEESTVRAELENKLKMIAADLDRYTVLIRTAVGKAGARIVECAKEVGADMIVMTKSTKASQTNMIGMTASYVIRHAHCNVLIVKEDRAKKIEAYRGLIYRKAESNVNLRGQLSLKQSECLLPSVAGDAVYTISVTRGRIRFLHRAFNPDTKEWDIAPANGQKEIYDISEGETAELTVNAGGTGKIADRIRIINRNMKTEAVFHYKITAAPSAEEEQEIDRESEI